MVIPEDFGAPEEARMDLSIRSLEDLKRLEFIDKVTNMNNSIYIEVNKKEKDWSYLILESINQFKVEFVRIDIDKFSLEEYFMELVGETIA